MKTENIVKPQAAWKPDEGPAKAGTVRWKPSEVLVSLHDRSGLAGEQYRKLSLKLEALNETLGGQMKVIVVTSPLMGDGKTATAANLAICLAQEEDRRVALLDCDTRNPRIHSLLEPAPQHGLYELLCSGSNLDEARETTEGVPVDLFALPPGMGARLDPLPVDRLKTALARLRGVYDYVVCDAPPVLPIADTAALVRLADGTVVVVRAGQTPRQAVTKTLSGIDRSKLIGFVLNAVNERSVAYYYYPYRESESGGGEEESS